MSCSALAFFVYAVYVVGYEKRDLIAQELIFAFTAPQKYTFPALHIGVCFASLSASVPEICVFELAQHVERDY